MSLRAGSNCTKCERSGTYAKSSSECAPCAPGKQPDADATTCEDCPSATYSSEGKECITCPAPFVARSNNAKCEMCPGGQGPCANCDPPRCEPCNGNRYSSHEGTGGRCEICPNGRFANKPDRTSCQECNGVLKNSAWSARTGNCECQPTGGVNNAGYYDSREAIIVCFHDGFNSDIVNAVVDKFTDYADGNFDQCQQCPDCVDCSVEGRPRIRPGYTLGEPHVQGANRTLLGQPSKQSYHHKDTAGKISDGTRYMHFVFFCDTDTFVTPSDVTKYGYFVTESAILRCNSSKELILPTSRTEVNTVAVANAEEGMSSVCSYGYDGKFCQSCINTYHKKGSHGNCTPCARTSTTTKLLQFLVPLSIVATVLLLLNCCSCGRVPVGGCITAERWRRVRLYTGALFPSVKTLITYSQVTGQIGGVLHVQYPDLFASWTHGMHDFFVIDVWSFVSVDCTFHWNSFYWTWGLHIVAKPLLLLLAFPFSKFLYDHCWMKEEQALQELWQNILRVTFLC